MKCEFFVNDYLPTIRAILAKKLLSSGFTQQEAADKLYISQTAVAFYKKQIRGKKMEKINIPEVKLKIDELGEKLSLQNTSKEELEKEYCKICNLIFK